VKQKCLALLVLCALVMGCSSGDDNAEGEDAADRENEVEVQLTPVATPGAEEARDLLFSHMLVALEMPTGLVLDSAGFSTNEEQAESQTFESAEAALERYRRNGRVLGYSVEYQTTTPDSAWKPGNVILVNSELNLYATLPGAQAAYRGGTDRKAEVEKLMVESLTAVGFTNARAAQSTLRPVGEEGFVIRITADLMSGTQRFPFVYDLMGFRRGKYLVSFLTVIIGPESAEAAALPGKQDAKLQAAR
jgi:hypothetical protein